jgi:hypothetical protein
VHRWTNKTILESFCRKMKALSPGYNNFEKCPADTELWIVFVKGLVNCVLFNFGVSLLWRLQSDSILLKDFEKQRFTGWGS